MRRVITTAGASTAVEGIPRDFVVLSAERTDQGEAEEEGEEEEQEDEEQVHGRRCSMALVVGHLEHPQVRGVRAQGVRVGLTQLHIAFHDLFFDRVAGDLKLEFLEKLSTQAANFCAFCRRAGQQPAGRVHLVEIFTNGHGV